MAIPSDLPASDNPPPGVETLVFVGFNSRIAALDRSSGEVVWKWKSPQGSGIPSLLLDGDRLIASLQGYTYCLDPATGDELWRNPLKGMGLGLACLASARGNTTPQLHALLAEFDTRSRALKAALERDHMLAPAESLTAPLSDPLTRRCTPMKMTISAAAGLLALGLIVLAADAAPAADNVPPPGFVALFNGKDLSGWKGLVASPPKRAEMSSAELAAAQEKADQRMRDHWRVEDGALVFDGKGDSLCTAQDYGDFELLVDWKILKDGDSGIYLRGSPQVQIWDPAVKSAAGVGSGGLFNNQKGPSKPLVNADNPVGEWNTFRIKMIGPKVSVWLNDKLVVDNVELENYWERGKPIYPTGQIELQNHGNTLYFKNIYLKDLSH